MIPKIVYSDREPGLTTDTAATFFSSFGITQEIGPAHSPQANLAERSVDKTKAFLRSILFSTSQFPWPQAIHLATIAVNQTKTVYGYTPYELFYGQPHLDNPLLSTQKICDNLDDYVATLKERYTALSDKVSKSRKFVSDKRNKSINNTRKSKLFAPNDLVWMKAVDITPGQSVKARNIGPFTIFSRLNDHSYQLAALDNPRPF